MNPNILIAIAIIVEIRLPFLPRRFIVHRDVKWPRSILAILRRYPM